jgi:hypothetical protein
MYLLAERFVFLLGGGGGLTFSFSERGSHDLSNGTNVACDFFYRRIYCLWVTLQYSALHTCLCTRCVQASSPLFSCVDRSRSCCRIWLPGLVHRLTIVYILGWIDWRSGARAPTPPGWKRLARCVRVTLCKKISAPLQRWRRRPRFCTASRGLHRTAGAS